MKRVVSGNIWYFFAEAGRIVRTNKLSYVFTLLSMVLILLLSGIISAGWLASRHFADKLAYEAEIYVYAEEEEYAGGLLELVRSVEAAEGVREARIVGRDEAYGRMEEILGDDAEILSLFDENPFRAFIEVKIDIGKAAEVADAVSSLHGVEYVRDNRELLEQVKNLMDGILLAGYLAIIAIGIAALISVSHIIRQGIYGNREQLYTLKLLGAPGAFTGTPYVITGFLLSLISGGAAAGILIFITGKVYAYIKETLPFIPIPAEDLITWPAVAFTIAAGILLGIAGSIFGLKTASSGKH